MRLHLVGLPHTQTTYEHTSCAFTQNLIGFAKMMKSEGHEVFVYSGQDNEAPCDEHVSLFTHEEQEEWFGPHNPEALYPVKFESSLPPWQTMNERATTAIQTYFEEGDFIGLIGGTAQKPIADDYPDALVIEYAVGYQGSFAKYRCFPSYAWMHWVYGTENKLYPSWHDAVIPHWIDFDRFPAQIFGAEREYLFWIGRMIEDKGLHLAIDIAKHSGKILLVAGTGNAPWLPEHCVWVGALNQTTRNNIMAKAVATIVPTTYAEPFGLVVAESMAVGTPVISTDWGAFPELVEEGVTGFRFRTLAEGVEAVKQAEAIDWLLVRDTIRQKVSTEVIAPKYTAWLKRLKTGYYG